MVTETREAPRRALQFAGGRCEFAASADDDGRIPVALCARSAQPITHWYWGRIVHDISGMQPAGEAIPLDYVHNDFDVIGYADEFDTSGDLIAKGALVPFGENDRVAEVAHKSALGVPYQASIFFDPDDMLIEEVPGGKSVEVNGYTFDGPGLVVREWTLRGVAVCPYGADKNTSVQFAADDTVSIRIRKDTEMANDTDKPEKLTDPVDDAAQETPPTDAPTPTGDQPEGSQEADTEVSNDKAATPTPPAAGEQTEKTGTDYIAAFGEKGAVWFIEGKTWDEAQQQHAAELTEENAELKKKLEAVEFGQADPVSFDAADETTDSPAPAMANQLGDNLARFAASIKLPAPSSN